MTSNIDKKNKVPILVVNHFNDIQNEKL